jgi:CheY-like chemotaxis protein
MQLQHNIHVLVADDHADFRKCLVKLLGFMPEITRINETANGREAVDQVARELYDVVLLDTHLPVLDGLRATRQIKAQWPQTKVILLSIDPYLRAEALASGADDFLAKDEIVPNLLNVLTALTSDAPML